MASGRKKSAFLIAVRHRQNLDRRPQGKGESRPAATQRGKGQPKSKAMPKYLAVSNPWNCPEGAARYAD